MACTSQAMKLANRESSKSEGVYLIVSAFLVCPDAVVLTRWSVQIASSSTGIITEWMILLGHQQIFSQNHG